MFPTPACTYPQARRPSSVSVDRPGPPVDPVIQGLHRFESGFAGIEQQAHGTHTHTDAMGTFLGRRIRLLRAIAAEFRPGVIPERSVIEEMMSHRGLVDSAPVNRVASWARDVAQLTQDEPPTMLPCIRECDAYPVLLRSRRHTRHPSPLPTTAEHYVPCPLRAAPSTRPSTPSNTTTLAPTLTLTPALRGARPAGNLPGIQITYDQLADIGRLERKFDRARALPAQSRDRMDVLCDILEELDAMVTRGDRLVRYARRRLIQRVLPELGIDTMAPPPATAASAWALERIARLALVFEHIAATPSRTRVRRYGQILAALDAIPSDGAAEVRHARRRLVRRILEVLGDRRPRPAFDTVATARALFAIAAIERQVARVAARRPAPSTPYKKALLAQMKNLAAVRSGGVGEVREAAERVRRLIVDALKRTRRVAFAPGTPSLDGQLPRIQSPPPPYSSPPPRRMAGRSPLGPPPPPSPAPTSLSPFLQVPRLPMHHAAPARMQGPHHPPSPSPGGAPHSVLYFGQVPVLVSPPRATAGNGSGNGTEHVVPSLVITPPEEGASAAPIARNGDVRVAVPYSLVAVDSTRPPTGVPRAVISDTAPIDPPSADALASSSSSDWEAVEGTAVTDPDGFEVV